MDIISYALSKKGMQQSVSDYLDEHLTNPTNPPIDTSLTIAGAAADSKETGSRITDLKEGLNNYVLSKYTTVNPTNWLNLDAVTSGYAVKADGTLEENARRCYTDYIPVSEGDNVRIYRGNNGFPALYRSNICLYGSDKSVVSGGSDSNSSGGFNVPSGVSFVRVSMDTNNLYSSIKTMITLDGVAPTAYSEYFEPYEVLSENFLTEESEQVVGELTGGTLARNKLANRYGCAIPRRTLRMTIELEHPWYINSLITPSMAHIRASFGGSDKYKRYADKIDFIGSTAAVGVNGYKFKMYDEVFGAELMTDVKYAPAGYGLGGQWANLNLSDCTVLAIGDSTIDQDTMTNAMLSIFTQNNHTLTLLGTLGSGLNKNEGRAGWSAKDYLTNRQYEGTVNPFYNPTTATFDFSYYMTNQGYSAPDFVVIQLGINDLYNADYSGVDEAITSAWNAIKTMVDSILTYNASIKIILNLPTAPNSDISLHTNFLPLYQNSVIRYNDYAQEQALLYSESKVRVSYCHLILNPETDIRDTVHPNTDGYTKMAEEVVSQINCWQNG